MNLNKLSNALYRAARVTRDVRALQRSIQTGSVKPLGNRMLRIAAGVRAGHEEVGTMSETAEHLEPIWTDRGFRHMPEIRDPNGATVQVYESSAAWAPRIWLSLEPCGLECATVHLSLEDAGKLRDQLDYLIRNHYQLEGRA